MHTIDLTFRRAGDWTLEELMDGIGVYCLWSGNAKERPSYLGEGDVLKRIVTDHMRDSNKVGRTVFDGFIAIRGYKPDAQAKEDCQIAEALLLFVAERTDRAPTHNKNLGLQTKVEEMMRKHPTLRLTVRGCDPLRPPGCQPIDKKGFTVHQRGNELCFDCDWRKR
ncbi:MAG: hypothetical protein ABSE73_10425 [Planctomycetota bacterium]